MHTYNILEISNAAKTKTSHYFPETQIIPFSSGKNSTPDGMAKELGLSVLKCDYSCWKNIYGNALPDLWQKLEEKLRKLFPQHLKSHRSSWLHPICGKHSKTSQNTSKKSTKTNMFVHFPFPNIFRTSVLESHYGCSKSACPGSA